MSYAPTTSNDENQQLDQSREAQFRLSDTERIAAGRLQVGGDGSLKEALAGIATGGPAGDDVDHLTDRLEAAQSSFVSAPAEPQLPFLFDTAAESANDEPSDMALLGLREWGEARAQVAAELADLQSHPLFLQEEARQAGGGTYWQRAERDAEPYQHPRFVPLPRQAPTEPNPLVDEPALESRIGEGLEHGIAASPPGPVKIAPLSNAFDAAAKLAVDADAAAAALESLTRLLHNHQYAASAVPLPRELPQREPALQPKPTPSVQQPKRDAPRPASMGQRVARSAPRPVARTAPPALRPVPVPNDRRQFDLRGFMAGFALSWAIGGVLYIYLMVG